MSSETIVSTVLWLVAMAAWCWFAYKVGYTRGVLAERRFHGALMRDAQERGSEWVRSLFSVRP